MKGQRRMKREKFDWARGMRQHPTSAERDLWNALRGRQLMGLKFRRQHPVFGYIADFYCSASELAIEVDGGIHEEQQDYDKQRDAYLAQRGVRVVRFTNDEVLTELPAVLERIVAATPLPEAP